jgi:hypothetical protein
VQEGSDAVSNSHTLNPSRSHARPSRTARLVSLFRGHGDLPDLIGRGDPAPLEYSRADVLARLNEMAAENAGDARETAPDGPPWPGAQQPRQPERLEPLPPAPWSWHETMPDQRASGSRPYDPGPLAGFLYLQPDPGPLADLGTCLIFRDTVRSVFVRQEEANGFRAPEIPWHERYAGLYRARTGLPFIAFGIADALAEAHEEAKAALEANILGRIDRIMAPVDPDVTEGSDEDAEHGTEVAA